MKSFLQANHKHILLSLIFTRINHIISLRNINLRNEIISKQKSQLHHG